MKMKRADLAMAKKEAKISTTTWEENGYTSQKDNIKTSSISYAYKEEGNICSSFSET